MKRLFLLCCLLGLSLSVQAAAAPHQSANGAGCPPAATEADPAGESTPPPVKKAVGGPGEVRPKAESSAATTPRLSPRWHSFLPGMFK